MADEITSLITTTLADIKAVVPDTAMDVPEPPKQSWLAQLIQYKMARTAIRAMELPEDQRVGFIQKTFESEKKRLTEQISALEIPAESRESLVNMTLVEGIKLGLAWLKKPEKFKMDIKKAIEAATPNELGLARERRLKG